jgi:hypothetical protein
MVTTSGGNAFVLMQHDRHVEDRVIARLETTAGISYLMCQQAGFIRDAYPVTRSFVLSEQALAPHITARELDLT